MRGWLLPVAVLVTSLTLTWLCCLRPMRRGRCVGAPHRQAADAEQLDADLARAHSELDRLRADHRKSAGTRSRPRNAQVTR